MTESSEPVVDRPARRLVIGGYTAEMDGTATGLRTVVLGSDRGPDLEVTTDTDLALVSPSFLVAHPIRPLLFAVSETEPGQVSSFAVEDDGLQLVTTVASGGDGGCHLAVSGDGDVLLVAHYTSGSVASFKIEFDGQLAGPVSVLGFDGSGPDDDRQDAAHAHQVVAIGGVYLVPDLGCDALRLVQLDENAELSLAGDSIALPAGVGPRHLVVTQDHLVVACELTAELWVKSLATDLAEPGRLVPASGQEPASGVRIYPSAIVATEHHVVVANRGVDMLAVFALDPGTSDLTLVAEVPAGTRWPRDLTVDGDRLWVAGQGDDVVAAFAITAEAPYLAPVGTLASPSPACVVVLDAPTESWLV